MNTHRDSADGLLTETFGDALAPIEPPASLRAQWLERLRGSERFTLFAAEVARVFGLTLDDALAALRAAQTEEPWVAGRQPGSRWMTTPALRERGAVISRLVAGSRIAKHSHARRELNFVLDGLLVENDTTSHGAGAVIDMPAGSSHELRVSDDEPCLVVFAER